MSRVGEQNEEVTSKSLEGAAARREWRRREADRKKCGRGGRIADSTSPRSAVLLLMRAAVDGND
jgi:hypothetical protein